MRRTRTALAGAALALALGGCTGTTVISGGSAPEDTATSTPTGGADGSSGQGIAVGEPNPGAPVATGTVPPDAGGPMPSSEVVEPRPGMANVHPVGWERSEVLGPRTVRIHFWGGVEPCYVLDHVEVSTTAKAVWVTLFSGSDPARPNTACIDIARAMAVDVTMEEPLRGREVLDGAPGQGSAGGGSAGGSGSLGGSGSTDDSGSTDGNGSTGGAVDPGEGAPSPEVSPSPEA